MKKAVFFLVVFVCINGAMAGKSRVLKMDARDSRILYSKLNVKVIDQDDVMSKSLTLTKSGFSIECLKWVVEGEYRCSVSATQSLLKFRSKDASTLYRSLKVKAEDRDDIQIKKLEAGRLSVACEHFVTDSDYECLVNIKK